MRQAQWGRPRGQVWTLGRKLTRGDIPQFNAIMGRRAAVENGWLARTRLTLHEADWQDGGRPRAAANTAMSVSGRSRVHTGNSRH
jgi:hypothetical protein